MDAGTTVTVCVGIVTIAGVASKFCGSSRVCPDHSKLLSRVASMQQALTILATYTIERATKEGRDLLNEVMELLMKK